MTNKPPEANLKTKVKDILAIHLGLEPEDINDEDSLTHDLHMNASDFSDLTVKMEEQKIDTSKVDFSEVESVADLVDGLGGEDV